MFSAFYYAINIKGRLSYLPWPEPSLWLSLSSSFTENTTLIMPLYKRQNGFVLLTQNCSPQIKIELSLEISLEFKAQTIICRGRYKIRIQVFKFFETCHIEEYCLILNSAGGTYLVGELLWCLIENHSWGCVLRCRWSGKEKWVAVGFALLARRMNLFRMNSHVKPVSLAGGRMLTWQVGMCHFKRIPILQGTRRKVCGWRKGGSMQKQ